MIMGTIESIIPTSAIFTTIVQLIQSVLARADGVYMDTVVTLQLETQQDKENQPTIS
jgi:hypothetical protein